MCHKSLKVIYGSILAHINILKRQVRELTIIRFKIPIALHFYSSLENSILTIPFDVNLKEH